MNGSEEAQQQDNPVDPKQCRGRCTSKESSETNGDNEQNEVVEESCHQLAAILQAKDLVSENAFLICTY